MILSHRRAAQRAAEAPPPSPVTASPSHDAGGAGTLDDPPSPTKIGAKSRPPRREG